MSYLKMRKVPQPLELRIKRAERNHKREPNCYGTAFFLLGVLPYDLIIFTNNEDINVRKALCRMKESGEPKDNSILISYNDEKEIYHAAFIKTANPFNGYQRRGSEGIFEEINSVSDIESYLKEIGIEEYINKYYTLNESDKLSDWSEEMTKRYIPGWWA